MLISANPAIKFVIIRDMLSRDNNLLNISWLCEIAGVSRSGYYYWLSAEKRRHQREERDRADFALIAEAYKYRGYDKGVNGIYMRLLRFSPSVVMNEKKIRRLMRKYGLWCRIRQANPYRQMAKAKKDATCAPNLLERNFIKYGSRSVILTDITYVQKRKDGKWTYLSVMLDAYTTEVLGYAASESLEEDFVLKTVNAVKEKHGSELTKEAMVHSDQGVHYSCASFVKLLADGKLRRSMSRRGNCWDNAPQESFFGHMKDEVLFFDDDTHEDVVRKLEDWIDYYNTDRPQWALAHLTPQEFYAYSRTGVYPLSVKPPKKCGRLFGGSAPAPPGFNALCFPEDGNKKDDNP